MLEEMVARGSSPVTFEIITATMKVEGWGQRTEEWLRLADPMPNLIVVDNSTTNRGLMASYQEGYERSTADILAFIHDDVEIYERGWDERVLKEFDDPKVGVVGFGGAIQHGTDDIYKTPYRLQQLGRIGYVSNTKDAETHGGREAGVVDVATVDGFGIVVRRDLLDRCGGWPVQTPVGYVGYDYWATLMAKRYGYKCRMVGIECYHLGGLTAVKAGITALPTHHAEAHKWLYEEFRSELPVRV